MTGIATPNGRESAARLQFPNRAGGKSQSGWVPSRARLYMHVDS